MPSTLASGRALLPLQRCTSFTIGRFTLNALIGMGCGMTLRAESLSIRQTTILFVVVLVMSMQPRMKIFELPFALLAFEIRPDLDKHSPFPVPKEAFRINNDGYLHVSRRCGRFLPRT